MDLVLVFVLDEAELIARAFMLLRMFVIFCRSLLA